MAPSFISGGQLRPLESAGDAGRIPVADPGIPLALYDGATEAELSPQEMWRSQPSVRKVVDFAARAIASTPIKAYRRRSDDDRERVTDHPIVRTLKAPRPGLTPMRYWHNTVVDWLLFDRYCSVKVPSVVPGREIDLRRIPAVRTRFKSDGLGDVARVLVDNDQTSFDTDVLVFDHGYSPIGAGGTTPMMTLSALLEENREAVAYRRSLWKNSARVPAAVTRPAGAKWAKDTDRERFIAMLSNWARGGGREGSVPLLEDGMTLSKVEAFSPRDTNDVAGRQLNDVEVASAFHIAPELVGAREGTFSNVQAYRQQLYRDGLGPYYVALEQVVNAMLVPAFDDVEDLYLEFDLDSKLRGSFEEQAAVYSTAIGRPWMTADEGRGRQNLRALGGDAAQLVTPLNVLVGGQASPRDSAPPKAGQPRTKAARAKADDGWVEQYTRVVGAFMDEQADVVLADAGVKADGEPFGDVEQWVATLAQRLLGVNIEAAKAAALSAIDALGLTASDYDEARTVAWLTEQATAVATAVNEVTRQQVEKALTADDRDAALTNVFEIARTSRAVQIAKTQATSIAGFGSTEAARQNSTGAVKRWAAGSNPRSSHARLDGETVAVDGKFSNGARWPGDHLLSEDERAGCNCELVIEPAPTDDQ